MSLHPPPQSTPAAGVEILGKYRLLDELGHGAAGVVYRAEDSLSGRQVAVKVIAPRTEEQRAVYSRLFFNEVRANRMLRHPSIVPILDAGREGSRFYVVMECVGGGRTLDSYCHGGALLPVRTVLAIALDCAEALHYAHGKGVIHRDVKPANVLLDEQQHAHLSDFGIAVLGDGGLADTSPFAAAGSPLYMAPEQVRQDAVTPATDLFALGVVLYQLLSGRHPFAGPSIAAITQRLLTETPVALNTLRGDLPQGLAELIDRTLDRRPQRRPRGALAMAHELSALLGGARRPLEGLMAEGRTEQLRGLAFFRDFGEAQLWELLRWTRWEEAAGGDVLVREGEQGHSLFVIVEGRVAVRKGDLQLAVLGPGECFGEIAYLSKRRRSASVVAMERASVLRVNADLMQSASQQCQLAFQRVLISTLIERLVDTTQALTARP